MRRSPAQRTEGAHGSMVAGFGHHQAFQILDPVVLPVRRRRTSVMRPSHVIAIGGFLGAVFMLKLGPHGAGSGKAILLGALAGCVGVTLLLALRRITRGR